MRIRGSRRKAYRASADGAFDDNIDFFDSDAQPFASLQEDNTDTTNTAGTGPNPSLFQNDIHASLSLKSSSTISSSNKGYTTTTGSSSNNKNHMQNVTADTITTLECSSNPSSPELNHKTTGSSISDSGGISGSGNGGNSGGKKRFKKFSFRRKSKSKNDKTGINTKGMTLLNDSFDGHDSDDANETSFGGNHTTTWVNDNEDDDDAHAHEETGMQVPLPTPTGSTDTAGSQMDDDGFFNSTFDFTTENMQFSRAAGGTVFSSFESAAGDWNPASGDFESFDQVESTIPVFPSSDANANAGANGEGDGAEVPAVYSGDGDVDNYDDDDGDGAEIPAVYSAPSPPRLESDDEYSYEHDHDGPIDSDTLQQWNPSDHAIYTYDPTALVAEDVSGPIDTDTLQKWDTSSPEMETRKQMDSTDQNMNYLPSNLSPSPDSPYGVKGIDAPIDVDTLQPWFPTRNLMWKESGDSGEESSVTDDEAFKEDERRHPSPILQELDDDDSCSYASSESDHGQSYAYDDEPEFAEARNVLANTNQVIAPGKKTDGAGAGAGTLLTLGRLAQISGLVDYDEVNTDQYGRTYPQDDDDTVEDEEAVEKAARQVIDPHEMASPEDSVSFNEGNQVLHPNPCAEITLPFQADVSEIEDEDVPLHVASPFKVNLSDIQHQSHDHIDAVPIDELSMDEGTDEQEPLGAPRALVDAFEGVGGDSMDTVEAELEMEELVGQVQVRVAVAEPVIKEDEDEEHNIRNIKEFWLQKQKNFTVKTDPASTKKARQIDLEWPDAPIASPLEERESTAFADDFFSRNKNKQKWDVPTSVTTTLQPDFSFATEMSSMCEDSFDLTTDGFPTKKDTSKSYRSSKSVGSSSSAKGFFWRSHPEGPVSKVEEKARMRSSNTRKKVKQKTAPTDVKRGPSEYINFPKSSVSRASQDGSEFHKEKPKPVSDSTRPSAFERVKSSVSRASQDGGELKKQKPKPVSDSTRPNAFERVKSSVSRASQDEDELQKQKPKPVNESTRPSAFERVKSMPKQDAETTAVPWDKVNLKLRSIDLSRSKSASPTLINTRSKSASPTPINSKSSPTKEWRKTIEATIKSTSEKVKSARNSVNAKTRSPTEKKPPHAPSSRPPSPFQANRNSFLTQVNKRQEIFKQSQPAQPKESENAFTGIPFIIEKKPLDDDAISGCSSSIADRIKAFETKAGSGTDSANTKPSMFSRTAPLNSYALSKLRNVTNNVGGLWS